MKQVTMHEAKTHLSRLVDLALAGEDVVIARRDRPLVRLVVIGDANARRVVGALPGLIRRMPEDFNAPIEDWTNTVTPKQKRASGSARRSGSRR